MLAGVCLLLLFIFLKRWGEGGGVTCVTSPLDSPLIQEYLMKLTVWLAMVIGITAAVECFFSFLFF